MDTGFLAELQTQFAQLVTSFGSKILAALAIFFIGFQIAKWLRRFASRVVERSSIDTTLGRFVINLVYYAILVFVLMAALDQLGVDTNSLVAVIGAAGLAAGLAMEGSLANFAAGVLIILLRPFKVGDYVEVADKMGRVDHIHIVQTHIVTFENETVILPNRDITDGQIVNYSMRGYVELELPFYVDFEADLDEAVAIMQRSAEVSPYVVKEPASGAHVLEMGETSVKLLLEANIMPEDRENATYDLTKRVMRGFQQANIRMPLARWRNMQGVA